MTAGRQEPERVDCPLGIKAIEFGRMVQTIETIAGDVEEIKTKHGKNLKEIWDAVMKQNGRVKKLENWRWWVMGLGGGVCAMLFAYFKYFHNQ